MKMTYKDLGEVADYFASETRVPGDASLQDFVDDFAGKLKSRIVSTETKFFYLTYTGCNDNTKLLFKMRRRSHEINAFSISSCVSDSSELIAEFGTGAIKLDFENLVLTKRELKKKDFILEDGILFFGPWYIESFAMRADEGYNLLSASIPKTDVRNIMADKLLSFARRITLKDRFYADDDPNNDCYNLKLVIAEESPDKYSVEYRLEALGTGAIDELTLERANQFFESLRTQSHNAYYFPSIWEGGQ